MARPPDPNGWRVKGGLIVELGGAPMADDGEELDDYDDDLAPPGDESGNPAFDMYAETALGSPDPGKISALKEAIRSCLEEYGPMGELGGDPLEEL